MKTIRILWCKYLFRVSSIHITVPRKICLILTYLCKFLNNFLRLYGWISFALYYQGTSMSFWYDCWINFIEHKSIKPYPLNYQNLAKTFEMVRRDTCFSCPLCHDLRTRSQYYDILLSNQIKVWCLMWYIQNSFTKWNTSL